MATVAKLVIQASADIGGAITQLTALERRLQSVSAAHNSSAAALNQHTNSMRQFNAQTQTAARTVSVNVDALNRHRDSIDRNTSALRSMQGELSRSNTLMSQHTNSTNNNSNSLNGMTNSSNNSSRALRTLAITLGVVAATSIAPAAGASAGALLGLAAASTVAVMGLGAFILAAGGFKAIGKHFDEVSAAAKQLQGDLAPLMAIPLEKWSGNIASSLGLLKPLAIGFSFALSQLADHFARLMLMDSFRKSLDAISMAMLPIVTSLGKGLLNFLVGWIQLTAAAIPLAQFMADGFLHLSESFLKWTATAGASEGFQNFMQWVKDNGPIIMDHLKNIAISLVTIGAKLAPLGMAVLAVTDAFLKWMASLSTAQLTALVVTIAALVVGFKLLTLVVSPLMAAAAKLGITFSGIGTAFSALARLAGPLGIVLLVLALAWEEVKNQATRVWEALQTHLGPAFQSLGEKLSAAKTAAQPFIDVLTVVATALVWLAGNIIVGAIVVLSQFIKILGDVVLGMGIVLGAVTTFIGYMISNFMPAMQAVGAAFVVVWQGMQAAAIAVWNALQVAWNALVNGLKAAWDAVSTALVAAWNAVWNGIATAAQAVWNGILAAWNAVLNAFISAWNAIGGALQAAWNAVWTAVKAVGEAVWNAILASWNGVINAIVAAWNAIGNALQGAWNAVWNAMRAAAEAIWTGMRAAWEAFINVMRAIWDAVSAALSASWNAVWNSLRAIAEAVWAALRVAWETFINVMRAIWDAVSSALSASWNAFWNAIRATGEAIWAALRAGWEAFLNVARAIWDAFSGALGAAWNAFWNAVRAMGEAIWAAMRAAWEAFLNVTRAIWDAFSGALGAAWNAFWNAVRALAEAVWAGIRAAWEGFLNVVRAIYEAFSSALGAAWGAFWNNVKAFAEGVWNLIRSSWQTLVDTVRGIYDGFAVGLGKAWGDFWNAVLGFAKFIWDQIGNVVETAINGVINIVNGFINAFNAITGFLQMDVHIQPIGHVNFAHGGMVPVTPYADGGIAGTNFARGGVLRGYSPGNDTVPAMLSPGEGILTPEAVRGLGGPGFVHGANKRFAGHRGAGGQATQRDTRQFSRHADGGVATSLMQAMAMGGITLEALARIGLAGVPITQPEYNVGVAASAGTHDRGGAVDFPPDPGILAKLLGSGEWAAWMRGNGDGMSPHIHGVLMNHPDLSPGAAAQVKDFMAGGDGLGVGGGGGGGNPLGGIFGKVVAKLGEILLNVATGKGPLDGLGDFGLGGGGGGLFGKIVDVAKDVAGVAAEVVTGGKGDEAINGLLGGMLGAIRPFLLSAVTQPILDKAFSFIDWAGIPGAGMGEMVIGIGKKLLQDGLKGKLLKEAATAPKMQMGGGAFGDPAMVQQWSGLAAEALARAGLDPSQLTPFLALMAKESGGNPGAINLTDSNAQAGIPSQGLMQVIPPTFARYRDPSLPDNILDPLANMTAAANYIKDRYGGIVPGSPYLGGSNYATPGWHLVGENGPEMKFFRGGESILSARKTQQAMGTIGMSSSVGTGSTNVTIGDGAIKIDIHGNATPETVDKLKNDLIPALRMALNAQ